MAFRKNEPQETEETPIDDGTADLNAVTIDQESMTDSVADKQRETIDDEPELHNVVRYNGVVSDRRISREDWEKAGVSDQDGVAWTKGTGHVVPIDQFSEAALMALSNSGEFQIIRDE